MEGTQRKDQTLPKDKIIWYPNIDSQCGLRIRSDYGLYFQDTGIEIESLTFTTEITKDLAFIFEALTGQLGVIGFLILKERER